MILDARMVLTCCGCGCEGSIMGLVLQSGRYARSARVYPDDTVDGSGMSEMMTKQQRPADEECGGLE